MKTFLRSKWAAFALAVFLAAGVSVTAQGATMVTKTVRLMSGMASTVDLGRPVADILVANPLVADVGTLRADRLFITGREIGDTNVLAFDAEGNQLANIMVHVQIDQNNIQHAVKTFFPDEDVTVRTVRNDIVLTGTVSNPSIANQVRDLVSRFQRTPEQTIVDLMKVAGEQQVMLKVKVIEAKRAVLREFGIDTDFRVRDYDGTRRMGGSQFGSIGGTGLQSLAPFGSGMLFIEDEGKFGPLTLSIQGMQRDGLVNTLAEPTLTAISGETAGFLAGGEFPVPTGRDSDGNITLEFKRFGVALNFTPVVMGKDRISMQISTEVSERSTENSVTLVNTTIPGLTVRRAETTVQMGSGGTLMMAGLIKSSDLDQVSGFPGIVDLPIIGELFKSRTFNRDESEVIILVTPYLVEPYARPEADVVSSAVAPSVSAVSGVAAPDETAAPVPARAPAPAGTPPADPLAQRFVDNLARIYGKKAPRKVAGQSSFGYIVD